MDKNFEKELEAFVDRVMEETKVESPSKDFTQKLMTRIEEESKVTVLTHSRPLISKGVLVFAVSVFSSMLFYVLFFYGIDSGEGWFQGIQLGPYFDRLWTWFEAYTSSKITLYAVILFGFFFMVQIPLLKRYMNHHGTLG